MEEIFHRSNGQLLQLSHPITVMTGPNTEQRRIAWNNSLIDPTTINDMTPQGLPSDCYIDHFYDSMQHYYEHYNNGRHGDACTYLIEAAIQVSHLKYEVVIYDMEKCRIASTLAASLLTKMVEMERHFLGRGSLDLLEKLAFSVRLLEKKAEIFGFVETRRDNRSVPTKFKDLVVGFWKDSSWLMIGGTVVGVIAGGVLYVAGYGAALALGVTLLVPTGSAFYRLWCSPDYFRRLIEETDEMGRIYRNIYSSPDFRSTGGGLNAEPDRRAIQTQIANLRNDSNLSLSTPPGPSVVRTEERPIDQPPPPPHSVDVESLFRNCRDTKIKKGIKDGSISRDYRDAHGRSLLEKSFLIETQGPKRAIVSQLILKFGFHNSRVQNAEGVIKICNDYLLENYTERSTKKGPLMANLELFKQRNLNLYPECYSIVSRVETQGILFILRIREGQERSQTKEANVLQSVNSIIRNLYPDNVREIELRRSSICSDARVIFRPISLLSVDQEGQMCESIMERINFYANASYDCSYPLSPGNS